MCLKLTKKIPERRHWRRSGLFIVISQHISHIALLFLLLTLTKQMPAGKELLIWKSVIFRDGSNCSKGIYGSRYSRTDEVKFVEDSLSNIWRNMVCLSRPYSFKFYKGYLLQILLGPFMNTLSHMWNFVFVIHLVKRIWLCFFIV